MIFSFHSIRKLTSYSNTPIQDAGAGLIAAAMIAIVPGYISRSVAGSYDNEGIAIFCMLFTYYLWVKSAKTGDWKIISKVPIFQKIFLPETV